MDIQEVLNVLNESIPLDDSVTSEPINSAHATRIRVWSAVLGDDTTVVLQGSADKGTTWVALAAAFDDTALGPQTVYEFPPGLVRLVATNADVANAEAIQCHILLEPRV